MKTENSINLNRPNAPRLFFLLSVFVLAGLLSMFLPEISSNGRQDNFAGTATNFSSVALQGDAAILQMKQSGAYDSLATAFEAARYRIKANETGAAANNEANDLRLNFTESGWQINSTTKDKNWRSAWRLSSFGYGARQTAAADGELQTDGNRIEMRRESQQLTEWFENTAGGVEHGFTLAARPVEGSNGEALRLVMTLGGDLTAQADTDGQALTLANGDGTKALRYEKLQVWDAQGKGLTARLRSENGGEVWLEVEDSAAEYPITIDPTFVQQQKLTATDGAEGDVFGFSVAIAGDTAVVGAFLDNIDANANQGSAYVFVRSGTTWTQQQKLTAADGTASDEFGYSVAIAGDTIIVGTHFDSTSKNVNQGSAYIFVRNGTTWTEQQKLKAADGAAGDEFGYSAAITGDTVIVGALLDNIDTNGDQGSAYVFVRNGTTWTQQQKLTAADGAAIDGFGYSVAIAGETIIVGALDDDIGTNTDQGSAYVFVRSGTTWTEQQKLTAVDGAASDEFGWSVAIAGDTALVGALGDDTGTNIDQGSAYIFVRSGTTWTEQQKLTAADGAAGDDFGWSVAIAGDTALVGALGDDIGTNIDQGSAYVFVRSGTVWTEQQRLTAADGAANDGLGYSVAIAGETMIVGAPVDSIGGNADQGSAYIFIAVATPTGFEADVASRPNGDGSILSDDVVQIRRFSNGTHTADQTTDEFQRADSSPIAMLGDGKILSDDVVQARRYQNGTNPKQPVGGPMTQSFARRVDMIDKLIAGFSNTVIENALNGVQREVRVESASASVGQMVTVNIRVDAQGDEAEYGFILNYDQTKLSKPVIGAGTAGASARSCNTATAGQINCSVGGYPTNNPTSSDTGIGEIASGTNQILITVTFIVGANAQSGTETPLTLSQVNASSDAPQLFTPIATNRTITIPARQRRKV